MAPMVYDVANGPLKAPGRTLKYPYVVHQYKEVMQLAKEGLDSPSEDIPSVEVTTFWKMVLGSKEVVGNPTVGEHGSMNSNSKHTEAIDGKRTILTKILKHNKDTQLKKNLE